jgi:hypothetical protein
MAIETLRELAADEIDRVAGGKKLKDARDKLQILQEELRESGGDGKGAGGASGLS